VLANEILTAMRKLNLILARLSEVGRIEVRCTKSNLQGCQQWRTFSIITLRYYWSVMNGRIHIGS